MRLSVAALFIIAGITLAGSIEAAQNDVIRIDTRLVEINVVIRDRNGSVRDLTSADFSLFDDGEQQTIDELSISDIQRNRDSSSVAPWNRLEPAHSAWRDVDHSNRDSV
jgi:hypothetical protein